MNVNDLLEKHKYFFGILLNLIHNLLFCIGPESTILKTTKELSFLSIELVFISESIKT